MLLDYYRSESTSMTFVASRRRFCAVGVEKAPNKLLVGDNINRVQTDHRAADLIGIVDEMFGGATPANTRWPSKALGEVGKVVTGNTPSRKVTHYYGTFVEWVKTDNINALAGRVESAAEALSAEGAKCARCPGRVCIDDLHSGKSRPAWGCGCI